MFTSVADILLGVNIDHIATVRNVRGTSYPSPLEFALLAQAAGADAITLHLREDRRHIVEHDVHDIAAAIAVRMNLEIAVTPEMLDFACAVKPSDVCLVPERRAELTTEGGLDVVNNIDSLSAAVELLSAAGIRVSLFIDPQKEQIEAAFNTKAPVIEVHTGAYANAAGDEQTKELARVRQAVLTARALGLQVNAGHGLHLDNTAAIADIIDITELNIGHAIVARALAVGFSEAVREFYSVMIKARNAALKQVK